MAFDRETGESVTGGLKSYRHAVVSYHLHPEDKFLGGDYLDRGFTERRHVVSTATEYVGKEANRWKEQFYLGEDEQAQVEYGTDPASVERMRGTALRAVQTSGQRGVAKAAGLSLRDVGALVRTGTATAEAIGKVCRAGAVEQLRRDDQERQRMEDDVIARAKAVCRRVSIRRLAALTGADSANLRRALNGTRRMVVKRSSSSTMSLIARAGWSSSMNSRIVKDAISA